MLGPLDALAGSRRSSTRARRALIPTVAVLGIGAAVAAAAVPAGAAPRSSAQTASHHRGEHHRTRHVEVDGVVAGHHGRSLTVFAHTTTVGGVVRHNRRVVVHFAAGVAGRTRIPTGDHLRLVATGTASGRRITVRHAADETVSTAPATLFVGSVAAVDDHQVTIAEQDRDNGDHADGDDHHGDDRDGRGDHRGGDGNGGSGHRITVDTTGATVTVDGQAGSLAVGDTVAVLGETMSDSVIASSIDAFTTPTEFLRGDITAISGDTVTVGDNDGDDNNDDTVRRHGGDDSPVTLSLTEVPLAINGDVGATPGDLAVGDKLVVLGSVDSSGALTPEVAFAFNRHDDRPCGDNDGGEHHRRGGDDGGSDG